METLKLSGDRKVSPKASWQKGKNGRMEAKVKVKNAFGLPAGDSCPGKTDFCESCYADKLQRCWTNVDKLVWHNFELLKSCGSNVSKMVTLLDDMVKSVNWYDQDKVFRWHWDGDIYSKAYAVAIAKTCQLNPDVQFYIYTRSFDWVGEIVGVDNLVVYLSVDEGNLKKAKRVYAKYPETMIAACHETWAGGEEIMRTLVGRNAPKCPEQTEKVPLVNADGVGACIACGMCVYGRNHVRFSSKEAKRN